MLVKHFFSVPVPEEEAGKIELFRKSFDIEPMMPPHITVFPPNGESSPRDLAAATKLISSSTPAFFASWENVVSWSSEKREYVVVLIGRGRGSLVQINDCAKRCLNGHHKYRYIPHVTIGRFPLGDPEAARFEKAVRKSLVGALHSFPINMVELQVKYNGHWEIEEKIFLVARRSL